MEKVIRRKTNQLDSRNFDTYARKLLIDRHIIKVDYSEQKKLVATSTAPSNSTIPTIELKNRMADVWELLKARQKKEL